MADASRAEPMDAATGVLVVGGGPAGAWAALAARQDRGAGNPGR